MRLLLATSLFLAACGGAPKSGPAAPGESSPSRTEDEPAPVGGVLTPGMIEPDAAGGGGQSPAPPPPTAPSAVPPPPATTAPASRGVPKKQSTKTEDPCAGGE